MSGHDNATPAAVKRQKRIILLMGVAAPFVHWITNAIVKLASQLYFNGHPDWKELAEPEGFAITLVLSAASVLAYLCYWLSQLRRIPELFEKLDAIIALQRDVQVSGVDAVNTATKLIDRILGTALENRGLLATHADAYNQSLEALGFKFTCWFEPVLQSQTRGREEMVSTWLRYSRTYNFEEAFDIKRREIATNSRNFTYLLLATLDSLAEHCRKKNKECKQQRYKVLHVAVTPVHPKDWFNWPHGIGVERAYFEEDFISHFWRCLREIKDAPGNEDVMILKRFVLSAKDAAAQEQAERKLGRRLKTTEKIKETLKEAWILPVSAPLAKINDPSVHATAKDALAGYYSETIKRAGYLPAEVSVIPLVCNQWTDPDEPTRNSLETLKATGGGGPPDVIGLANFCKEHHRKAIQVTQEAVANNVSGLAPRVQTVWAECKRDCDLILAGSCASLHSFIVNCHKLDARLCEQTDIANIYRVQELLRSLVASALRLDDCLHRDKAWPDRLPSLGEVFTTWLHHSADDLKVVKLDSDDISKWFEKGIRNEFHLFGIQDVSTKATEWSILVAADINEPFQVAKILLLEEGAQARREGGKNLAGFDEYKNLVEKLLKGNSPFNDVVGKVEPAWIK